jgi:peptidoglycan/LPS O-acetylase OafA/YrhL
LPESPTAANHAIARNPGIDLLRGISIVLVLLNHIGLRMRLTEGVLADYIPRWFLNDIDFNGYEAVFLFFVISGFLITSNTLARWGALARIHIRTFYVRRAARILPCLLILVAVLSLLHLAGAQGYVISEPGQSLPRAVVSALGLHLNWYEGHTGYLPAGWDVLWSLSIEEVFYLGFPLVCITVRKDWLLAPVLALLAVSLPVSLAAIHGNGIWKEKAYLPGMAGIAMGVLGGIVAARYRPTRRSVLVPLTTFGACGILAVLTFENKLWPILGNGTILLLTFSAICLVFAFHGWATRSAQWTIPATGWLRSFGRLSYEIYLTHMFVILAVVRVFKWTHASLKWGVLWYPPALALSWLLGWLVAKYISNPAEREIRRRFLLKPPAPLPVAAEN